jgi:hypothetical protein
MRSLLCLILPALAGLVTGCGGTNPSYTMVADPSPEARVRDANDLRQIGLGVFLYRDANGKSPEKAEDLKGVLEGDKAWERLRDGEFVVVWAADLAAVQAKGQSGQFVLGYEKNVPTRGGLVLFANTHVAHLTAEQFRAAPKAPTK